MAQIRRLSEPELWAELAKFERQFGMSSTEFYRRWRTGAFEDADREEYLDWASLCVMARLPVEPSVAV